MSYISYLFHIQDTVVVVVFSDYDMSSVSALAGSADAYSLKCQEIDGAGVSETVTASAAAS